MTNNAGTLDCDGSQGSNFEFAMADTSYTLNSPTNLVDGRTYRIKFFQNGASGTGSIVSYNGVFAFPNAARPQPATGNGKISIIEGVYKSVVNKILCTMAVDYA